MEGLHSRSPCPFPLCVCPPSCRVRIPACARSEFYEARRAFDAARQSLALLSSSLDLPRLRAAISDREQQAAREDLWEDAEAAQKLLSELTDLRDTVTEIEDFQDQVMMTGNDGRG